jgi:phenylacetate-CoA ligase
VPQSTIGGIAWPAIPDASTAQFLALAFQLEQSQWWPAAELRRQQERQLALLLAHAVATSPHYAKAFAAGVGVEAWEKVPILTRQVAGAAGADLFSLACPPAHGKISETATSRTTGDALRIRGTAVVSAMWQAVTLREHLWHRRDLSAHLGVIRYLPNANARPPDGLRTKGWGAGTAVLAPDAPLSALSIDSTTEQQVAWLVRENPVYLLIYPTILEAIVRRLADTGQRLPALREIRTTSEAMSPTLRGLVRDVLGVRVVDMYSSQEVGYIALQCPDRPDGDEGYHVQAERLLVEILRDDGTPCAPGEIGRVVVTDLHNFATPFIRYEMGDYAEVGAPCACGRGLPTLKRVVGRRRGMLVYPDGRTAWPLFTVACREATRYRELQLVQETVDTLRVRVVPEPGFELDEDERRALAAALHKSFNHGFTVTFEIVEQLGRTAAGKLEEFVSHVKR